MKKLVAYLLVGATLLGVLGTAIVALFVQQGMVSRSELAFLVHLGEREGPVAVYRLVKEFFYGTDPELETDPSYGRVQVEGRGHAPWVLRSNIDGRPRILLLALAPGTWAAYDSEQASLYQLWDGEVLFEGAAYDYHHGPQPSSSGNWYLREPGDVNWFIETGGKETPAQVTYLGHEYGEDHITAALRFSLTDENHTLEITEQPEVEEQAGQRVFTRTFKRFDSANDARPVYYTSAGERIVAEGVLRHPMHTATAIEPTGSGRATLSSAPDDLVSQGEAVISGSDCLSCHAETHRVSGPAWAQVAGKFRGKVQRDVVASLADKVIHGSTGAWGQLPMPAHPNLSRAQAKAAVTYILSVDVQAANAEPPRDSSGQPYPASDEYDYDILPRLREVHPSFQLDTIAPPGFEPKVGGMALREDGKLLVASWDRDGAVFLVDPGAPEAQRVQRIAEGLHEPLGLAIVDDRLYVLQKQELTELIDLDGDGIIDRYRAASYDWPTSSNFHSFAFGLEHREDSFYFLLSVCVLPGGASCPEQLPTQGKMLRVDNRGKAHVAASGFRTPNGIAAIPGGNFLVTDNQGDWLPASKLIEVSEGGFYGSHTVPGAAPLADSGIPPIAWLPQDEVGNSPTEPLQLAEGPYEGQWIFGDVYNGGLKRVFLDEVEGQSQGAAFHFSGGLQAGVNRLLRGQQGEIYLGEVGNSGNWGQFGKAWHGLQRLTWTGNKAFEMRAVRAHPNGFNIELTQPLARDSDLSPADVLIKQWFYHPNEQYGGPKYDETELVVTAIAVSPDRKTLQLEVPGLKAGYVVYLRLDERLRAQSGDKLWTAETWYTLNRIPGSANAATNTGRIATTKQDERQSNTNGWRNLFDGKTLEGWRNYGGEAGDIRKWQVEDGTLALQQKGVFPMWDLIKSVLFGGPGGDLIYYPGAFENFELSLQWKISPGGNSGIFYLVKDETENVAWRTGLEMQVLDNDGHADGAIHTHRAGDLYDLVAADPETVRPPGEWNDVLIRVEDNHIEHWLNGEKVVSIRRGSQEWNELVAASKFSDMPGYGEAQSGYIVLQDHGDPVWYRNIRIREL